MSKNVDDFKIKNSLRAISVYFCGVELLGRIVSGHDVIIHYAAELYNGTSIAGPEPFLRVNIEGTYCLLEAARNTEFAITYVDRQDLRWSTKASTEAKYKAQGQ